MYGVTNRWILAFSSPNHSIFTIFSHNQTVPNWSFVISPQTWILHIFHTIWRRLSDFQGLSKASTKASSEAVFSMPFRPKPPGRRTRLHFSANLVPPSLQICEMSLTTIGRKPAFSIKSPTHTSKKRKTLTRDTPCTYRSDNSGFVC